MAASLGCAHRVTRSRSRTHTNLRLFRQGWRKPSLLRSKRILNSSFNGLSGFLPALCSYRSYLVIHRSREFPSADFDALSNVIFDAAIFHLRGTRSTCAISLCRIELVSPSSQSMVTPLQAVQTIVPRSVALAFQQTRSPTLRSLDCSPVTPQVNPMLANCASKILSVCPGVVAIVRQWTCNYPAELD